MDAVRAGVRLPLAVGALYLLFRWGAAGLRLPTAAPAWILLAAFAVTALLSIGLPIAGIAALVRPTERDRNSLQEALQLAGAGLAVWCALLLGLSFAPPGVRGVLVPLEDLAKIAAAAGLGMALARGIREPNILLPAGLFAAFADLVVVKLGTVKHALAPGNTQGQKLVQAVSAQVPAVHPSLPVLTIGPADFLFLGLFLACAARFGDSLRATAWALAGVLALSLVLVPLVGPVPALAPMSLAFVAVNWRMFRLTREELLSTVLVLVVMGALFAGFFMLTGSRR